MPKITVYSCSYNAEKYIVQCIESVLNQTFTDFEYIIRDNGSTDKTKDIIREYEKRDKRIKFVDIYGNPSVPFIKYLNEYATGEYLVVVDGDDYIDDTFLEEMYYFISENNLSLAVCGTRYEIVDTEKTGILRIPNSKCIIDKSSLPDNFINLYQFLRTIWGKIMILDIVLSTDIQYQIKNLEYGGYGSDTAFMLAYLDKCTKIGMYDKVLHNYRIHKKSISYKLQPLRMYTKDVLYKQSTQLLKGYGEINPNNYYFINLVYFYSIIDELNVIKNSQIDTSEKIKCFYKIINQDLSKQILNYFLKIRIAKDINEKIKEIVTCLIFMLNSCNEIEQAKLVYECLIIINNNFVNYLNINNIYNFAKEQQFICGSCLCKSSEMLKFALLSLEKQQIANNIEVSIRQLISKNMFLNNFENINFLKQYSSIILSVFKENYNLAINEIITISQSNACIKFEEELLKLLINISSYLEDVEVYIYANKQLARYYILNSKINEAHIIVDDLLKLLPNDEDVLLLDECLLEY
ncbi:glycosyltransferase family 2 protein [Sedimentibacter sp. zth1]|uniref:glycosyltransferase family 2 protein n=1 Tax=Sedimentibacter sp. zth1 TaxID=2816908 RepID=UPI001A915D4D|nr:glycosyltransferase family 2 protein [Sedimentibacter sp. zth1]QSX07160.1 glycosyltransferase family 2 protein [Sedimentibacter sp. zth1]